MRKMAIGTESGTVVGKGSGRTDEVLGSAGSLEMEERTRSCLGVSRGRGRRLAGLRIGAADGAGVAVLAVVDSVVFVIGSIFDFDGC